MLEESETSNGIGHTAAAESRDMVPLKTNIKD